MFFEAYFKLLLLAQWLRAWALAPGILGLNYGPITCNGTLVKLPNPSIPQFLQLQNGNNNNGTSYICCDQ